jgi:simple sugar transport system permease protein
LTTKIDKIEDKHIDPTGLPNKSVLEIFTDSKTITSVMVVLLGFLTATLLLVLIGKNPLVMYQAMLQVVSGFDLRRGTWNIRYVGEWISISMPLILCGLSMGFSVRTGLFNIGAEGQYIAGLTAAQLIAVGFVNAQGARVPVHFTLAVLGAMFLGALWGGIAGFFKARYKVSEVVATIMMNYIALFIHRLVTLNIPGSNTFKTPNFPPAAALSNPFLTSITNRSSLNNGLWFTIAAVVIYWLIMEKSTFGFSLRAAGFNKDAALYAGMRVKTNITAAMAISGAFAGLAGAVVSLGVFTHGRILTAFEGYGFDGIAVALAGNCSALGTTIMGLLFGMLKSAQPLMQLRQIPREITSIIMGMVVIFIALRPGIQILAQWRKKLRTRGK